MAAVFEQQCNNIIEILLTNDIQAFQARLYNSKLIIARQAKDLRMLKNLFQMKQNGELQAKRHRRGVY